MWASYSISRSNNVHDFGNDLNRVIVIAALVTAAIFIRIWSRDVAAENFTILVRIFNRGNNIKLFPVPDVSISQDEFDERFKEHRHY